MKDKMEVLAVHELESSPDLYKLVDFLNKNLKDRNIIFGLSKKNDTMMAVTIYKTE